MEFECERMSSFAKIPEAWFRAFIRRNYECIVDVNIKLISWTSKGKWERGRERRFGINRPVYSFYRGRTFIQDKIRGGGKWFPMQMRLEFKGYGREWSRIKALSSPFNILLRRNRSWWLSSRPSRLANDKNIWIKA